MQVLQRAAITTAIALTVGTVPLTAQRYHWDFGVYGGYSWLSGGDLFNRNDFDFFDNNGVLVDDNLDLNNRNFNLGNGGMAGAQLGYWFSHFGVRGNFAWASSNLDGRRLIFPGITTVGNVATDFISRDVNLWSGTLDLMYKFKDSRTKWDGFEWLPYVALGAGATWVDPRNTDFRLIDSFDNVIVNPLITTNDVNNVDGRDAIPIACAPNILITGATCAVLEQQARFTGLGAIGMDLRFSPSWAGRLEFGDRIWKAPVRRVLLDQRFPFFVVDDGSVGRTINQLYVTAGIHVLWGFEHPPVHAAVAPPPRPAPPPPPPPPSTESITVCVVDPNYAQGLRTITATHNLQTNDTTVTFNGRTMRLSEAVANVPTAGNAPWFIRGAPLEIGSVPNRMQYTSVGSERMIEPEQLAYLGTVGGVPVFADRATIPPGLANLGPNTDLNTLVMQSADARKALDTVGVIYVPMQPVGCTFQALQKMQEVRKNKELEK